MKHFPDARTWMRALACAGVTAALNACGGGGGMPSPASQAVATQPAGAMPGADMQPAAAQAMPAQSSDAPTLGQMGGAP